MHRTKIDLADNVRASIIGELSAALADRDRKSVV